MTRRELIRRSMSAARIYRGTASSWVAAQTAGLAEPEEARQHIVACRRAALRHELLVEHSLGRVSQDELLVGQRLLPTWHGEFLSEMVDVVRKMS